MRFSGRQLIGTLLGVLVTIFGVCFALADELKLADVIPELRRFQQYGVTFGGTYIGEALSNSGGVRSGAIYAGRLDMRIDVEMDKLIGWSGATLHANMFQIHGDGLSRSYVGNLLLVSGIEALPSTRLYELWLEQSLFGGALAIRVGQQASDIEFIDSKYDDIFINSALGWPGITGVILPSGGPSPPLAVPGVRFKAQLSDAVTAYLGIFDGDAAPPGPGDPQIKNPNGILFRVNDPPWVIGQVKVRGNLGADALPWTVSLGGWRHFGSFDDLRRDTNGVLLADPVSSGTPARLRANQGVFAVYEQLVARSPLGADKGAGVFVRASVSPSDRNLINFYVDGGVQFTGFSASRPDDKIGLAAIYAKVSQGARQFDRDVQILTGISSPIRDYEAVFEATYGYQLSDSVLIQPMFQYVMHPGGGRSDPDDPRGIRRLRDAAVFGLRTTINF